MYSFRSPFFACASAVTRMVVCCLVLACAPATFAQDPPHSNPPDYHLKVDSRLVLVNVIVRDQNGKVVEGLGKQDFKLLDRGKEQTIVQFEAETADELFTTPTGSLNAAEPIRGKSPANRTYTALFFDTLHDSESDLVHARDAASQYLTSTLKPTNRIAVFTSESMISGFSLDPVHVGGVLSKLQPSARSAHRGGSQPFSELNLSDYQALEMLQTDDCAHTNAWLAATASTGGCYPGLPLPQTGPPSNPHIPELKMKAREVAESAEADGRHNLLQLQAIVKYLSGAPGKRTLVLVSSGFLSQSEQHLLDQITALALQSQIMISSVDPKGLTVSSFLTAAHSASSDPHANSALMELDSARQLAATDVLQEFAKGTGGQFLHNDNDLRVALDKVTETPAHYMLGFNPGELKDDGKYHELKVSLRVQPKGMTLQARKGYYATRTNVASVSLMPSADQPKMNEAQAKPSSFPESPQVSPAADASTQLQNKINLAVQSKDESIQLPIGMEVSSADQGGQLSVLTHLDITPLHFLKEADHNSDTVIFTIAVFDQSGKMVLAKQRNVKVNATDAELQELRADGLEVTTAFPLQPGAYRVRAVVADSDGGMIAAISRDASLP